MRIGSCPSVCRTSPGCEHEAVKLAERWGEDPGDAAEAGILHDITKKFTPAGAVESWQKNMV